MKRRSRPVSSGRPVRPNRPAWMVLRGTLGIRVSAEEEREGLDWGEHGNEAYPYFVASAGGLGR